MRVPERLMPLVDQGVIQEVVRPLMSGKEADVYLVIADDELRVAKVYKEAQNRSFRQRSDYTEGRKVRNTREQRAMDKRSKYGKKQVEASWRSAEVDAIYKLKAGGVTVPEPYDFVEGVLVMQLITGPDGDPAPRLVDMDLAEEDAEKLFAQLLSEIVKSLLAGVVHGDLSDFNILMGPEGPVLIDFPQAVDPAHNNNAKRLFIRDLQNVTSFLDGFLPRLKTTKYGEEIWALYEAGQLTTETELTGRHQGSTRKADTTSLLEEIEDIEREAAARREALGLAPPRPARAARYTQGPRPTAVGEQPARSEKTHPDDGRQRSRSRRHRGDHKARGSDERPAGDDGEKDDRVRGSDRRSADERGPRPEARSGRTDARPQGERGARADRSRRDRSRDDRPRDDRSRGERSRDDRSRDDRARDDRSRDDRSRDDRGRSDRSRDDSRRDSQAPAEDAGRPPRSRRRRRRKPSADSAPNPLDAMLIIEDP